MEGEVGEAKRGGNAGEEGVIAETEENIECGARERGENERSTRSGVREVKEMRLEEAQHYSEKE